MLRFQNITRCSKLIHSITTRRFESDNNFNLADYAGINRENAITNRRRLCKYLNLNFDRLTIAQQTHNNNAAIVTEKNLGTGKYPTKDAIKDTDALITELKDTPLMMFSADCPLVIIYDKENHILSLMHCSWRSIVKGLIENTLKTMADEFDAKPKSLICGISPSAGKCCYQVNDDFVDTILSLRSELKKFLLQPNQNQPNTQLTFDLRGAIKHLLAENGVIREHIETIDICTICNCNFFSYRREGKQAGRFALIASLK